MNFLGNSKPLLLVYRNMGQQKLSQSVDIMLTPQFYTLKKETLPLKYVYQAKKVAQSLFDGYLMQSEEYEYFVYKEESEWVFIAYNEKEIIDFLSSKGVNPEQVSKIYFAQQSMDAFKTPVLLGKTDALIVLDGVVVNVPQKALSAEGVTPTNIGKNITPKQGVTLQSSFHSFLSRKRATLLASVFLLFAVMYFVEGWRYAKNSAYLKAEITELLEEYPALQSEYTRKNIAQKYRSMDAKERQKRNIVKRLAGLIFKGVKVERFTLDDKHFSVRFHCSTGKVTKHLRDLAAKEGFSTVKTLTGNIVEIKEQL